MQWFLIVLYFLFWQESYTYRDPITEFVECLYVNFDFDGAQKKLRECETVSSIILFFSLITDLREILKSQLTWNLNSNSIASVSVSFKIIFSQLLEQKVNKWLCFWLSFSFSVSVSLKKRVASPSVLKSVALWDGDIKKHCEIRIGKDIFV